MAIVSEGNGATGDTGGLAVTNVGGTAASLPSASDRLIVARVQVGQTGAAPLTVTFGGVAPSVANEYFNANWWQADGAIYVWTESDISSMSGTAYDIAPASGNIRCSFSIDYYSGAAQTLVGSGGVHDASTFAPSQGSVTSGDLMASFGFTTYAAVTYGGTGSQPRAAFGGAGTQPSDGYGAWGDKSATSTTVSDSYTTAATDGGCAWIVIGQAAASGVTGDTTDGIDIGDAMSAVVGGTAATGTTTDGVDVGDAVSAVATRLASAVEGVDIGDAFSALTSGGSAGTIEGVDIGDAFSAVRARVGSVLDGLKLGDTPSAVAQGASSSPLFIGASLVAVTRHSCRYEPLGDSVIRNYRGTCLSAITTARGFFRVWNFDTPEMTSAVAASFEADISTGDLFTVTGYLVGSSTVTVAIANIQREDSALYSRYSFELIESV